MQRTVQIALMGLIFLAGCDTSLEEESAEKSSVDITSSSQNSSSMSSLSITITSSKSSSSSVSSTGDILPMSGISSSKIFSSSSSSFSSNSSSSNVVSLSSSLSSSSLSSLSSISSSSVNAFSSISSSSSSFSSISAMAMASGAFNTFDETTFSASTCTPLPIEEPVGIFVSPTGSANASGSKEDPLDLASVFAQGANYVQPGETLWLMEGTYVGNFRSYLGGTEANPISVRPYPGKRVILKSPLLGVNEPSASTLRISDTWVNYYGLEIMADSTNRSSSIKGSSAATYENSIPTNYIDLQGGVSVGSYYNSSNTKIINFIVHDTRGGLSSFSASTDSELYGNIIYNNGWTAPDRGHGHAIYTQNRTGYKKLTNNIIFFGFGTGIHAYYTGTNDPENSQYNVNKLENYDIQGNVWFSTGASDPRASQKKDNCLVGGVYKPVKNLLVKNNLGYSDNYRGVRFGYGNSVEGQDALLIDNYFAEGFYAQGSWNQLQVGNSHLLNGFVGDSDSRITDIGGNVYGEPLPKSGKKVFVSENAHDARRARITIYNYDEDDSVAVDVSSVLKVGEAYRIHSVFDLFGEPIVSGLYNGEPLDIPMGSVTPVQPIALDGIAEEDDPKKKFGVFLLTHAGCQ